MTFVTRLLSSDFLPHGTCYMWNSSVLWLNVISDGLIALAYYAIPFVLISLVRRRRDFNFRWIFVAFAFFILACGTTHLMGVITVWNPVYRLDGVIKAITAAASIATFLLLIPMMPALVALPSPSALARVNVALSREIEERKKAEGEVRRMNAALEERVRQRTAELAQANEQLTLIMELIPQQVWTSAPDGTMDFYNGRWLQYTGLSLDRIRSTGWREVIHPEDLEGFLDAWQAARAAGSDFQAEARVRRMDGEYRWMLVRARPYSREGGQVAKWYGSNTDIEEQKRAEQELHDSNEELRAEMERRRALEEQLLQSQKLEAVGRLAGGIAHDFNNLLTAISGYNDMVMERVRHDSELTEYATEIGDAATRAAALTAQMLAFSRRRAAEPQVIDLNQAVTRMDKMLRRIIGEDIELVATLDRGLPAVKADPSHIDQVIMNLAVNARDAMPEGGTLFIETRTVMLDHTYTEQHFDVAPGRYVVLEISDTGVGMDAETQQKIFEPFFTTKPQGKGTGLGLSLVYGIVKQNGGHISVYSDIGKGATFKIYLPAVETLPERADAADESIEPQYGRRGTILLVEDEAIVRKLLIDMLRNYDYTILEADSPEAALKLCKQFKGHIDLLLSDVVMPQMSGPDLARLVQEERPELRVLLMSGYTDRGVATQGVDPAVPFLQKPFTAASLLRKIGEVLKAG